MKTLGDCVAELAEAITAGHELTVRLTLAEAHEVSRIPVSTLRWLCTHKASDVGATKHEGAWYLDRAVFERYLGTREGRVVIPATEVRPLRDEAAAEQIAEGFADREITLHAETA